MKVAFQKWGNSLALRVPKAFVDEIGASEGRAAEMTVSNGKLVIEIARPQRRRRRCSNRAPTATSHSARGRRTRC